jgi:hypothetical protein
MQTFASDVPAVIVHHSPVPPGPLNESESSAAQTALASCDSDQSSDADSDELPEVPELPDSSDGHDVRPKSEPELSSSAVNQSVQSASEAQSMLNQLLQQELSIAQAKLEAARAAVSRANEEEARAKQAVLELEAAVAAEKFRADTERRALIMQIDAQAKLARRALLQVCEIVCFILRLRSVADQKRSVHYLQLLATGVRAVKRNLTSKGKSVIRLWYQPSSENLNLFEFDPNGQLCWQSEQPLADRHSFRIGDIVSLAVSPGTHDTFLRIRPSADAVMNGARPSLFIHADAIIRTVLLPALHSLLPSVAFEEF